MVSSSSLSLGMLISPLVECSGVSDAIFLASDGLRCAQVGTLLFSGLLGISESTGLMVDTGREHLAKALKAGAGGPADVPNSGTTYCT
jgi:hypothetical protein